MLKAMIVASVLIGGAWVSRAEAKGKIAAVVVDQAGNPVQGALVRADRMDEGLTVGVVPQCLTDKSGKCLCDHLALGEYTLNASKADAGYPPMYIPLYRHGQPPKTFRLTAGHPIEEVSLTLGPKAASIEVLVTDAATGKPVKNSTVLLRRMANPNDFFSTQVGLRPQILVPADDPILVEITADGYEAWDYKSPNPSTPTNTLTLHSQESKTLRVELQPRPPSGLRP